MEERAEDVSCVAAIHYDLYIPAPSPQLRFVKYFYAGDFPYSFSLFHRGNVGKKIAVRQRDSVGTYTYVLRNERLPAERLR